MKPATEKLVNQHREYLKEHPNELLVSASIFEHMFVYFTQTLGLDEHSARLHVDDVKTDVSCDIVSTIASSKIDILS
ncbi:hypothetical protein LOZ80_13870 [Paenibacillus sp. HWE-109]|uniref:hypothetical protein n=1 Tax=Paenibacillus sp. HWE-109 TaxID=1306526 RepID=UPI001EE00928|nr:hypothetical protein [Paenibacillus sp. HWE-109]UKS29959.1 hypothetical protein LOZ80_13870 [Paenibacillus sp. HWE-109]